MADGWPRGSGETGESISANLEGETFKEGVGVSATSDAWLESSLPKEGSEGENLKVIKLPIR